MSTAYPPPSAKFQNLPCATTVLRPAVITVYLSAFPSRFTPPCSWRLYRGGTLLWDTTSEVRSRPRSFCALSEGWCVRLHTSGLDDPREAPNRSVRLCFWAWGKRLSLTTLVITLETHDFHYLKYLLKISGTWENSRKVIFWGLVIISVKYEQDKLYLLTDYIGNPWHHWQGARWRATGREHLLTCSHSSPPPAATWTCMTLSAATFNFPSVSWVQDTTQKSSHRPKLSSRFF